MKNRMLLLILLHASTLLPAQDNDSKTPALQRFEFSRPAMGTEFRILCYAPDSSTALRASNAAFDRIAAIENSMSDYREDSEISRLATIAGVAKKDMAVSEDLWKVLSYAKDVSKRSEGAFDVTTGALTKLWRRAFRQMEFPDSAALDSARATVGYKDLVLGKNNAVQLKKPGMRIDLGGIAKGFAVDEAMAVLQSQGINVALVDGGGDLRAGEAPPGTMGWLVEKPQFSGGQPVSEKVPVKNAALATSGDTYRFLEYQGKRYSHIIDPRTGLGVTSRQIVTVTAPTCMMADAWATAMSVEVNTDAFLWLKKQGVEVEIKIP
jgi:thiamine biosynthesis lipoprotein